VGARVPDGEYRVEVQLSRAARTLELPRHITLDTVAPTAQLVSYLPSKPRPGQKLRISYRVSEPAHGVLFVNGKRRVVTYTTARAATLPWRPTRRGRYRLQLAARDLAGNLGPRSPVFLVRVR
jgi:hypothetical protein